MTLRLNGSTSGYTEIDAPAVAGNNTLLLPGGNGTADQALVTNGSGTLSFADRGRMVLETAKAWNWNSLTTNTVIDFTSIPSWVKRVTVMMNGVSTNGTSLVQVQIGTSAGVESSGYVFYAAYAGGVNAAGGTLSTSGFVIDANIGGSAAILRQGLFVAINSSANAWTVSYCGGVTSAANYFSLTGGGSKTLSGTLDRVRITTVNGTDTFDAGSINLLLEG